MSNIFSYDNKFFQIIGKLMDCFYISILWVFFSIPIVTIGASATAMYYAVNKVLRGNRSYVWRSFWGAFRSNFKQATIIWLVYMAVGILFGVDIYITHIFLLNGYALGILFYIFIILFIFLILWGVYLFSYTARFENSTKEILKNSGIIAIANLPKTILLFVILVVGVLLGMFVPFVIPLIPAVFTWAMSMVLESVFRKYMSKEDLEREKELDMESKL
ncbi:MAG: YesL family protein [Lachnospiraceae bacterium]|nr:YesL family protein [Lachnospiraceae bacterium]